MKEEETKSKEKKKNSIAFAAGVSMADAQPEFSHNTGRALLACEPRGSRAVTAVLQWIYSAKSLKRPLSHLPQAF